MDVWIVSSGNFLGKEDINCGLGLLPVWYWGSLLAICRVPCCVAD